MAIYDFEDSKRKILARRIGLAILAMFPKLNEPGVFLELKQKFKSWTDLSKKDD